MKHLRWLLIFSVTIAFSQATQKPMSEFIRPPYLKTGDTVAIVAPAGVLPNDNPIPAAKELLESWGLHVKIGSNVFTDGKHFAGSDAQRANDFQTALDDITVKAVWAARGGYGTVRIIDRLDFSKFTQHPKWVAGYSDITVLHSHLHKLGYETIHSIMGSEMDRDSVGVQKSIATLKKAFFGKDLTYDIKPSKYNKPGTAKGQIIGGNLSILQSLLGSETQLDTAGKILFIEEVGEYKYAIDRMLHALKRAGYFEHCKGLVVGGMTKIKRNTTSYGLTIEELVLNVVKDYDFPVLFNFPAGHGEVNEAIVMGREVEIIAEKETAEFNYVNGGTQ